MNPNGRIFLPFLPVSPLVSSITQYFSIWYFRLSFQTHLRNHLHYRGTFITTWPLVGASERNLSIHERCRAGQTQPHQPALRGPPAVWLGSGLDSGTGLQLSIATGCGAAGISWLSFPVLVFAVVFKRLQGNFGEREREKNILKGNGEGTNAPLTAPVTASCSIFCVNIHLIYAFVFHRIKQREWPKGNERLRGFLFLTPTFMSYFCRHISTVCLILTLLKYTPKSHLFPISSLFLLWQSRCFCYALFYHSVSLSLA